MHSEKYVRPLWVLSFLIRDNDRRNDIRQDSGSAHQRDDHPYQPDKSRIDIKVFRNSAADTTLTYGLLMICIVFCYS